MKTAEELRIPEEWRRALVLVLEGLERGEIRHTDTRSRFDVPKGQWFNMTWWETNATIEHCGTAMCIGGWADHLGGVRIETSLGSNLDELFYPGVQNDDDIIEIYAKITPAQAALAIRNYLEHGEPRWKEVLARPTTVQ